MKEGDRVVVIGDDMLNSATGTVTKIMDSGCIVDLDKELFSFLMTGLYFELEELEVVL